MKDQLNKDYVLGLDLGNTNVGITAIDDKFNIIKYKDKKEQQVNIFDEAQTAEKRRLSRSSRRNLNHKQSRLKEFNEYIFPYLKKNGVDTKQLKDTYKYSFVSASDLALKQHRPELGRILASGKYKNFWFAINDLINDTFNGDDAERAQLIYECLYVLIKHRGNFLLNNSVKTFEKGDTVLDALKSLNEHLAVELDNAEGSQLNLDNLDEALVVNADNTLSTKDKNAKLTALFMNPELKGKAKKLNENLAKAVVNGGIKGAAMNNSNLYNLFGEDKETFDKTLKLKIDNSDTYQAQVSALEQVLSPVQIAVLHDLIDVANGCAYLEFVQRGKTFVESRLEDYDNFKKQLHEYKNLEHLIDNPKDKKKLKTLLTSYLFYERTRNTSNSMISYAQFTTPLIGDKGMLKKYQKKADFADPELLNRIVEGMKESTFLIKTRSGLNASIPHQVYQAIMRKIIKVQSKHKGFEWLTKHKTKSQLFKDEEFDLERFINFRIPYYVGPLTGKDNRESDHAWVVYKKNKPQKLSVFNLEEIVDLPKTATKFIQRQIGYDSRLLDEKVMPASSLLYQEFNVLNEINMIRVKSKHKGWVNLTVTQRDAVIEYLFKKDRNVSTKALAKYLNKKFPEDFAFDLKQNTTNYISGLSDVKKFNSSLDTFILFNVILGKDFEKKFTEKELSEIATILTVFDANSLLLKRQELSKIKNLTPEQVEKLSQQSFSGWGNLSYKMLTQITDENNMSVIDHLRDKTGMNLQKVLAIKSIKQQIDNHVKGVYSKLNNDELIEFMIKNAYLSPSNKRSVKQALKQIQYTINFNNRLPKMIVVENARGGDGYNTSNAPKVSRIHKMLEDAGEKDLIKELKPYEPSSNSKKTSKPFGLREYLYFRQLGRNIYKPNERLSLEHLHTKSYEIDHINPQSKNGKDNSLNNLVLTTHEMNQKKSNHHSVVINKENKAFWNKLQDKNLITHYQYKQLTTDWDNPDPTFVNRFLSRSLVEINQVNRIVLMILHQLYPEVTVIGLNSSLPSHLRHIFNLPKVRNVNYYHHGVDSFLVAFTGLYLWKLYPGLHPLLDYFDYDKLSTKFTKNINLNTFGFNALYDKKNHHVKDGIIVNKDGEIVGNQAILQKLLTNKSNPKHMRMYYLPTHDNVNDGYYNATKYGRNTNHNEGKALCLRKGLNTKVYGYYQSVAYAYMQLVKVKDKRKSKKGQKPVYQYKFTGVPIIYRNNPKALDKYTKVSLNADEYTVINPHVPLNATIKVGKDTLRVSAPNNVFFTLQAHLSLKSMNILTDIDKATNDEINFVFKDIIKFIENHDILTRYRSYYRAILEKQDKFIESTNLKIKKRELNGILKNLQSNKSIDAYTKDKMDKMTVMGISPMNLNQSSYAIKPIILSK